MSRQVSANRISPQQFGRVAVLLGGTSAEREISLKSGNAVLQALLGRGVNAVAVDPLNDLVRQLSETHFDRAFVVLHGRGGEDGTVQGLLEFMGIPYTGSNVMGSAIAMDKLRTKQILRACEIPTADWCVLTADNLDEAIDRIGLPMFLKPAREGSSIGMSKVMRAEELRAAFDVAAKADALVIAEPCLPGPEYTVAILGDRVLPTIRLETTRTFYDYEAKYLRDDTQYHIPCGLSAADEAAFGELCLQAFRQVGASGWGRVDYMMDERGVPRILEVNTVPGMTDHSLVPMAAKAAGIEFDQLVFEILAMTLQGESQ